MNMQELTGKVIKLANVKGLELVANHGEKFPEEILQEFSELKVVRVYRAGEPDMSTGATGNTMVAFISCVPVSKLATAKYDAERDSYDFEWNFFEDEIQFFEVVA